MKWILLLERWLPTLCKLFRLFSRQKPKALKCLIVEDDKHDAERLQGYITRLGHEWEWVQSGEEAIGCVTHSHYPICFVDLRLFGMSGADFVRQLSKLRRRPKVVIVYGQPYDLEFFTPGGFICSIRKTVTLEGVADAFDYLKL